MTSTASGRQVSSAGHALEEVYLVETASVEETRALGAALAASARPGDRIDLVGDLGAGKTQLAKGFALGLGVRDVVNSPSFTLMAEYQGRIPLFHLDLFRLAGAEDVLTGGLLDERQADGVTLVEWPQRMAGVGGPADLEVTLVPEQEDRRSILLRAGHAAAREYLRQAREWRQGADEGPGREAGAP